MWALRSAACGSRHSRSGQLHSQVICQRLSESSLGFPERGSQTASSSSSSSRSGSSCCCDTCEAKGALSGELRSRNPRSAIGESSPTRYSSAFRDLSPDQQRQTPQGFVVAHSGTFSELFFERSGKTPHSLPEARSCGRSMDHLLIPFAAMPLAATPLVAMPLAATPLVASQRCPRSYLEGSWNQRMAVRSFSGASSDASSGGEKEMISVTFVQRDGSEKTVQVPVGTHMLQAAHDNDIDLEGACEASLACSTCHVIVMDEEVYEKLPEPSDEENDMLDLAFGLTDTSRLGCQVVAWKELDGIKLKLPAATRNFAVDGFVPKPH